MEVLIDTREQQPMILPCSNEKVPMKTGDISIKGLESVVCFERKKISELWGLLGSAKDRFLAQLDRMMQYPIRILIIEGTLTQFLTKQPYSKLTVNQAINRLMRWTIIRGIPIWFLGERSEGSEMALQEMLESIQDSYRRQRGWTKRMRKMDEVEVTG